jgi:hypothetical protein
MSDAFAPLGGVVMTHEPTKDDPAQARPQGQPQDDPELQNEGEGSRSAARRYDRNAEQAAANPARVEELGKIAKEALDGPGGQSLRDAEERGKQAQHN